jgi:hypothetical protein
VGVIAVRPREPDLLHPHRYAGKIDKALADLGCLVGEGAGIVPFAPPRRGEIEATGSFRAPGVRPLPATGPRGWRPGRTPRRRQRIRARYQRIGRHGQRNNGLRSTPPLRRRKASTTRLRRSYLGNMKDLLGTWQTVVANSLLRCWRVPPARPWIGACTHRLIASWRAKVTCIADPVTISTVSASFKCQ